MSVKTSKPTIDITHPEVAAQWHPTKNGDLTPDMVTHGLGKKAWWICKKKHAWKALISNRAMGRGCPYCANKKVGYGNDLETINPQLAKEWNSIKNGNLKPSDFNPSSGKKVWWICEKKHEWDAAISSRNNGNGCPYCSHHKIGYGNDMESQYPKLAKEWHPTKNGELKPSDVVAFSHKKVWWMCDKRHEWDASIPSRRTGSGCPYCSNKRVGYGNDLETVNPKLAKEWHPTKNGQLKPSDVVPFSNKKVWWRCDKGHEWDAVIKSRNVGYNCRYCSTQTSRPELYLYSELCDLFKKVLHRNKIKGHEVDIFISDLKVGIEYDGYYYHKQKLRQDKNKRRKLRDNDIDIIAIREKPLSKIEKHDYLVKQNAEKFSLVTGFLNHLNKIAVTNEIQKKRISTYLRQNKPQNEELYKKLLSFYPGPLPGKSLSDQHPNIAKEWHPSKNGNLSPFNFAPFSNKKIWWICDKGHEWNAMINTRSAGRGCPYCTNRKVGYGNDLETVNPKLAKEWHPTKNGQLKPSDVVPFSNKKVWWICDKGHEWNAMINSRSSAGRGCPYCSHQKVGYGNDLATKNPKLAKEWHPTKNGDLKPNMFTLGSNKKVWWICYKGHEWDAVISSRSSAGKGCPYCSHQKVGYGNDLATKNPKLAKEWHPTKNGDLKPNMFTLGSNKKVWWLCNKDHEWEAYISNRSNRTRGTNCPHCYEIRRRSG